MRERPACSGAGAAPGSAMPTKTPGARAQGREAEGVTQSLIGT